jgi:hypothetical protein
MSTLDLFHHLFLHLILTNCRVTFVKIHNAVRFREIIHRERLYHGLLLDDALDAEDAMNCYKPTTAASGTGDRLMVFTLTFFSSDQTILIMHIIPDNMDHST